MAKKLTRRILLINWKWRCLVDYQLNDTYLEKHTIDDFFNQKEKKPFYETLRIGGLKIYDSSNNEKEENQEQSSSLQIVKGARIICCNIYKGNKTRQILNRLIEETYTKYSKNGDRVEIMLFLHRGHHYDYNDVLQFLEEKGKYIVNCFLFETGRDYIYYHSERKGLLDHIGRFYRGKQGKKVLRTYHMVENSEYENEQEKIVDKWYFNNVWNYYKQEFKRKLKILFIDFVKILLGLEKLLLQNKIEKDLLIEYLEDVNDVAKYPKSDLIYYRIKSFLGCYDEIEPEEYDEFNPPTNEEEYELLNEEIEQLSKFEKKRKKSYTFDDVRANLEHKQENDAKDIEAHNIYKKLEKAMRPIFLKDVPHKGNITKQELMDIRDEMGKLIAVLPGNNL